MVPLLLFIIFYLAVFSSILLGQNIFLSDGQLNHFFKELSLWDSSWAAGYYIAADPVSYHFYPLRILFYELMPNWLGFDLYVISAYVLASFFTYGYIKMLTNDSFSSFVGGIIFGFGGFMMAHLGHTSMIHTAAWLPLLFWSAEKLKYSVSRQWVVVYVISVVMMILAGHLQIFTYAMLLLALYISLTGKMGAVPFKKYLSLNVFLIIVSICISTFQLYPTFEFAQLGFRKELSFQEFNTFILSVRDLYLIFFPHVLGNARFGSIEYFGLWNLSELTVYSGIISILIAVLLISKKILSDRMIRFWFLIAVLSLLLALGDHIHWLSKLIFELPVINKFRALARHAFEFNFSIAVLAGIGLSSMLHSPETYKNKLLNVFLLVLLGVILVGSLWYNYPLLRDEAKLQGLVLPSFMSNPAIYWSIVVYALSVVAILFVLYKQSLWPKLFLMVSVVLNLSYFSFYHDWNNVFYSKDILTITNGLKSIKKNILLHHTRIFEFEGYDNKMIQPMRSSLFGMNTVGWYGPLITKDYSEMTGISTRGDNSSSIISNKNLLNMLNIEYIFVNKASLDKSDKFILGGASSSSLNSKVFELRYGVRINRINIISSLAFSRELVQGTKILDMTVVNSNGDKEVFPLYAGIDSAEWAHDCADVSPFVKHKRAKIYSTWTYERKGYDDCDAHSYITSKDINLGNIKRVIFKWNEELSNAAIDIKEISILSNESKKTLSNETPDSLLTYKETDDGAILKNTAKLQKAWLVKGVTLMPEKEILDKIRLDRDYSYLSEAFVSNIKKSRYYKDFDEGYSISTKIVNNGTISIEESSESGGFLVLSESYHKGWKAYIDGVETDVYKTNNILNGIFIPKGTHQVEFRFLPISFFISLAFSFMSLVLFMIFVFRIK